MKKDEFLDKKTLGLIGLRVKKDGPIVRMGPRERRVRAVMRNLARAIKKG